MTTYATLVADVAGFLNREDLTAAIPAFIRLAEAQFNRDIRHWQMENRAFYTANDRYIVKPTDWLETIRLSIEGEWYELEPMSTREMADRRGRQDDAVGTPRFFRNSENGFELFPTPDGQYQFNLEYYQKIPAIDAITTTTNWLLTNHYDIYMYGCLMHAGVYLHDDEMLAKYLPLVTAAIKSLERQNKTSMASGAGRRLRVRGLGGSRRVYR